MDIKKDFDVVNGAVPNADKGYAPMDNPGIRIPSSIPMTAGEKASNDTSQEVVSNSIPKGLTKGGGYYD